MVVTYDRAAEYAGGNTDFEEWLRSVDGEVQILAGVGLFDLSDTNLYDAWEDGKHPYDQAIDSLDNDGFPF